MRTPRPASRPAFVQVELAALVLVAITLVAVLTVAGASARHRARMAGSISNLQKFAAGITAFASDNEDRIVSFSWRVGETHTDRTGLSYPAASSDLSAAANQAIGIIRWHANRSDIAPLPFWIPHILYNHLALVEYLDHPLPAQFVVSPFDLNRLAWQRIPFNGSQRSSYSSSYEFAPAAFSPDASTLQPSGGRIPTFAQAGRHAFYSAGNDYTPVGRRRVSEIVHPDKKALVYETYASDSGGGRSFYAYDHVKTPILFGDGSVSARSMADANPGFNPDQPFDPNPTVMEYRPSIPAEPPTQSGAESDMVLGRIRWTRSGLRGRDFGGPEVQWKD